MTHKLHEIVPPFTLYLSVENAPNPAQKHFEKANITVRYFPVFPTQPYTSDT